MVRKGMFGILKVMVSRTTITDNFTGEGIMVDGCPLKTESSELLFYC